MRSDELMGHVLTELSWRLDEPKSDYDLARAAGLLRQLLLDREPLLSRLPPAQRRAVRFTIVAESEERPPPISDLLYWGWAIRPLSPHQTVQKVTRYEFIATPCCEVRSRVATVKDLIRAASHVLGGVHHFAPENDEERALVEIATGVGINGLSMMSHALRDIGLVAVTGVRSALAPVEGV